VTKPSSNTSKDLPVDLAYEEKHKVVSAIWQLEKAAISILQSNKIHKKDTDFFIEKTDKIIASFFDTNILFVGVSPHLAFCMFLFVYFADGASKKREKIFDPLADIKLYDEIFVTIDNSKVLDWGYHNDCVTSALQHGVGYSVVTTEKKQGSVCFWCVFMVCVDDRITHVCEAASQNDAKSLAEKANPHYAVYLVSDAEDLRLNRKRYSIPKRKDSS
jgi:hypothetical protein